LDDAVRRGRRGATHDCPRSSTSWTRYVTPPRSRRPSVETAC